MTLTDSEQAYLSSQRLGRLATVAPDGTVQNNPVGFRYNTELGTVDVGGANMGGSRKFRNVEHGSDQAAFVVDDVVSTDPWQVRGIEIRGRMEALRDQQPYLDGLGRELLRLHPRLVFSWQVEPGGEGMTRREI